MLFLILLHSVIVKMAFGRGNLEEAAVSQIGWVWICYLFGFTLYAIGQVFVRAHLVLKNTSALMKCAFYMVFLNIVLDYVFMKFFGVAGIAMATSASRIFPVIYLGGLFYKKTI